MEQAATSARRKYRWLKRVIGLFLIAVAILIVYIRTDSLIYNESFWTHGHCIKITGGQLLAYADQHHGRFPTHSNGYGNALLLLEESADFTYTGPGYSVAAFKDARRSGMGLPEAACGRVYVQGLTIFSDSELVILFDKLPTPGGDHCLMLARLTAPLGREVVTVSGIMFFVAESDWPPFARKQVELLVKSGVSREEAERLYLATRN